MNDAQKATLWEAVDGARSAVLQLRSVADELGAGKDRDTLREVADRLDRARNDLEDELAPRVHAAPAATPARREPPARRLRSALEVLEQTYERVHLLCAEFDDAHEASAADVIDFDSRLFAAAEPLEAMIERIRSGSRSASSGRSSPFLGTRARADFGLRYRNRGDHRRRLELVDLSCPAARGRRSSA